MKIYIFGASGYLGSHFTDYFKGKGWEVFTDRVDIRDLSLIEKALDRYQPDVVLNSAGITGTPNVDWCETHKEAAALININGAINLAAACHERNIYFAHVGSGCVYEGDGGRENGFIESDEPNFSGSFYSRTKAVSEKMIADITNDQALQLRVRIPIEGKSHAKNVIDKLLKYERVASIPNSFTIVEDFIPASYQLIEGRHNGIFNMTNVGWMDHKFLMEKYREIVDPSRSFEYMDEAGLASVTCAARSNCILDTQKREKLGISMPNIKERIPAILEAYRTTTNT